MLASLPYAGASAGVSVCVEVKAGVGLVPALLCLPIRGCVRTKADAGTYGRMQWGLSGVCYVLSVLFSMYRGAYLALVV